MPKEVRISVRIDRETKRRLELAASTTKISEAVLVKNCVEALLDYIEENGSITFPLAISPKIQPGPMFQGKYPAHRAASIELNETKPKPKKGPQP